MIFFKRTGQVLGAAMVMISAATANEITDSAIKLGYLKHAALAQFHRWYQYYERSEGGIENAVDILTPDVFVKSTSGEANGTEEYKARVAALPESWKNAHFLKSVEVTVNDDETLSLDATITYLNAGMRDDGAVVSADLSYDTTLVLGDDLLPKFSSIEISQNEVGTAEAFTDAYAENRALSVIHYYLAIIEDPSRDPEPAREVFAGDFSLNFSSGPITDFEGFKAWLAGTGSAVVASTHEFTGLSVSSQGDTIINAEMTFDWAGITPDGTKLIAQTHHRWQITNDVTERFARIKRVDVEIVIPFQPATAN